MTRHPAPAARRPYACTALLRSPARGRASTVALLALLLVHAPARADAQDPTSNSHPVRGELGVVRTPAEEAGAPAASSACAQRCTPCDGSGRRSDAAPELASDADADTRGARRAVDLNKADEHALLDLPGIGPARARAILAYRESHGAFHSIAQLLHIKGIGRALLKQLRPLLTLSGPS